MKRSYRLLFVLVLVAALLIACDNKISLSTLPNNDNKVTTGIDGEDSSGLSDKLPSSEPQRSESPYHTEKYNSLAETHSTSAAPASTTKYAGDINNRMYLNLQRTNHTNIAAPKIANAFIEKDVDTLEAMMCLNIKENTGDLRDKISEMMDAVDGEITDYTWKIMGSYSETQKDRRQMLQVRFVLYYKTSTTTYRLSIMWETANNFNSEEVGIRDIFLTLKDTGDLLAEISATEGIGEWHD